MNIIGVIPGRMASTRFPNKPLAKINGIPMIGHVFFRSKMCKSLNEVYIATCDQEIFDYAISINGKAVMTASTHERACDRAAEAMLKIEQETSKKIDILAMIQGDEPMLVPEILDQLVEPMINDNEIPVTNLITTINSFEEHDDPNTIKVVLDENNYVLYFSREPIPSRKKWSKEIPMFKQLGIIAFKREAMIKFMSLPQTSLEKIESIDMLRFIEHGIKIKMIPINHKTYGVDTIEDLEKVEKLLIGDELVKKYSLKT
jgi:3-deoxy-manno-octulosonate cytidylyltransferase (CMP-KDO synthetase)